MTHNLAAYPAFFAYHLRQNLILPQNQYDSRKYADNNVVSKPNVPTNTHKPLLGNKSINAEVLGKTVADGDHILIFFYYYYYFSEKMRLGISCESYNW